MTAKSGVYVVCVLAVMVAIFMFSSQPYEQTMKTSDVIVKPIENLVKEDNFNFQTKNEENDYIKELESMLDKAVRKSAHMIIFGVLGVFVYLFCKSLRLRDADAIIIALVFCALYGGIDEFHQMFVSGRTSQFVDVCVDEMGVVISMIIIRVIKKVKEYKSKFIY